jgi:hypothetical protein
LYSVGRKARARRWLNDRSSGSLCGMTSQFSL